MLSAILILSTGQTEPAKSQPRCSIVNQQVAFRKSDLPAKVLEAFGRPLADPGEPFHVTDAIRPGEEAWPFDRLICGYSVRDGYVIERERGGLGYTVGMLVFRRTSSGYVAAR